MTLYDAFISYSHAKDKPIAAALQSVVQKLGKPWYRRRALRVFRDDTSLSATPQLWPSIEQALGQSRYFILLASPEAAASKWVNKEVAHWLDHNSIETLLIGVTDGELSWDDAVGDFAARETTPLPPVLAGRFPVEPKWVDLTAYRESANPRDAKLIELGADFAAAIHGMPKEDLLSQEVRQQRHALTLAWSGVAILAMLMVLAGWQWREAELAKRTAVAERDTATRNFKIAQGAADSLVVDIAQGLRNAQGLSAEILRQILETAKATIDQLAALAPEDPTLQQSRSTMLNEFGETYQTLGEIEEALKAFRESFAIRARLAAAEPGNAERQRDLSESYTKIGDALAAQGEIDAALKSYRDGLDINKRLVAGDPSNIPLQDALAASYIAVADTLIAQDKPGEAIEAYRESIAIYERLLTSDSTDTDWQRSMSVLIDRIGQIEQSQGQLEEALKSYRDSLDIAEQLAASDPSNTQWQRDLSASYIKIGLVLVAQGKLDEALKAFRDDLAIAERLAASDPSNADWRNDLATSIDTIGNLSYRFVLASNFARALEVADQIIASAPDTIWLSKNRAHALMFLGRTTEARALYVQHRGAKDVRDEKSWEAVILQDFIELRKVPLTRPLMDEIEKRFSAAG